MTPVRTAAVELTATAVKPSPLVDRTFGEPRLHTDGDVCGIAFAADGTLRSVDETGVLRHWAADGKLLARHFLSDLETVWAFSPDTAMLASGNDDLLLWDTAEGQLLGRIPQASWVTAVAFAADGRTVASGHDDGSVRFFDAHTRRLTGDVAAHPQGVSAVAFDPTGERLATAGEDRVVRVWDAASHKLLAELRSHTDRVPALTWNADGSLLVSAGWDTSARVWKPSETADPLMLLNSHAEQVLTAAFSPDGRLLATADSDNDVYLWADAAAAKVKLALRGHAAEVRCLAFNRDGTRLASAGGDRVIHVWDTADGKLVAGPNPSGRHAIAYVAGPTPRLASTGGPQFRLWDVGTGAEVPPSNDGPANAVAATADGRFLAVGGTNHCTRLYDLTAPGTPAKSLEATKPPIGALAFSPDGKLFAQTSPADGLVWLWNPTGETGNPDLILIEAADGCTLETVAVHPDGKRVAVGGIDYLGTGERDGAVCVWDATTKLKTVTFDTGVTAVAFDPQGRFLAAAGLTDRVHVWDLTTEEEVLTLEGHSDRIQCVAFSPDGNYLLSGGDDLTVRVWDVLGGRPVVAREFDSPVQALAFTPDGKTLFVANGNTTCHQVSFAALLGE